MGDIYLLFLSRQPPEKQKRYYAVKSYSTQKSNKRERQQNPATNLAGRLKSASVRLDLVSHERNRFPEARSSSLSVDAHVSTHTTIEVVFNLFFIEPSRFFLSFARSCWKNHLHHRGQLSLVSLDRTVKNLRYFCFHLNMKDKIVGERNIIYISTWYVL